MPETSHCLLTSGRTVIEMAATLAEMKTLVPDLFSTGQREDVVVWEVAADERCRVVLVKSADGRKVEMDGASLTWRWSV